MSHLYDSTDPARVGSISCYGGAILGLPIAVKLSVEKKVVNGNFLFRLTQIYVGVIGGQQFGS